MFQDNIYFTLREFLRIRQSDGSIHREPVPTDTEMLDKLFRWMHILNPVRIALNHPVVILTALRSMEYELRMGRDGTSQHVFRGDGAIDLRCGAIGDINAHNNKQAQLAELLYFSGQIGRITYYPAPTKPYSRFHIDRKIYRAKPAMFVAENQGWVSVPTLQKFLQLIENRKPTAND